MVEVDFERKSFCASRTFVELSFFFKQKLIYKKKVQEMDLACVIINMHSTLLTVLPIHIKTILIRLIAGDFNSNLFNATLVLDQLLFSILLAITESSTTYYNRIRRPTVMTGSWS